jgi:type I restriction enzyme, S subunit
MGAAGQNGFHNKALASAPGIIVGRCGGSFGQIHFAKNDFWPHNTALFVTDFKGNDPYFAYYFLKNLDFSKLNSGSAQPSLNRNYVYPIKISVPRPAEQQKIAAVLSALDAKIDCNNRINAELEVMAKTLYDYWFVQFDFPDANGKPYKSSGGKMVYNATLKREIPAGWDATTLASITPISNDSLNPADFPKKEFKHFSIPVFDATKTYGLEFGQSIGSNKFTVLGTDLLVSKLNPWFSRVIYAMDETDQICSTELVVWRCPTNNLKNFLFLIATSSQFIAHCVQSASGTSNSHKRVNPNVMMRFALPYQNDVAEKFWQKISPILKKLIINQRENQQLTQLRDWLLPLLMNGQVTVA